MPTEQSLTVPEDGNGRLLTAAMVEEIRAFFPHYPTRLAVVLPAVRPVRTYPVQVEGDDVQIDVG